MVVNGYECPKATPDIDKFFINLKKSSYDNSDNVVTSPTYYHEQLDWRLNLKVSLLFRI